MDLKDISNYGGFIIGFLGILLSIYLFRKSKETKEPRCLYRTYREIEKLSAVDDSSIKIFFKSDEVERVFTTYIWFWNRGKKALTKSDIPPQSNIILQLVDEKHTPKILDHRVLKTSREETNIKISTNGDDSLSLSFDFLDHNDGAVFEIQHTGSDKTKVISEGIILGVPKGIKVSDMQSSEGIMEFYQRIFISRTNSIRPPQLYIRKSIKIKIRDFLGFVISIISFATITLGFYYVVRTSSQLTITSDRLQEILLAELPQLSNHNLNNILAEATVESKVTQILVYSLFAYFSVVVLSMCAFFWRKFKYPFPTTLYFEEDEEDSTNSKN